MRLVVGLVDGGVKELADVDERDDAGDEKDQRGDGENEFGVEAHGRVEALLPPHGLVGGLAVLFELVVEGLEADAEDFGGSRLVLAGGLEGAEDQQALALIYC
jgi:hypothetical protein